MTHWTEEVYKEKGESFAFMLERKFDDAKPEVENALALLEHEKGLQPENVLDIGCGLGRHVIWFASQGYEAEGIDISESYLERARETARERGVEDSVRFRAHDMRDLDELQGPYDLVTNFFDSFGYFGKQRDTEILSEMQNLLSEDGALLMQISSKEGTLPSIWQDNVQHFGDWYRVQQLDFDIESSMLTSKLDVFRVLEDEYAYEDTLVLEQRLYSPVEFTEMCREAGFDDISLYGGFEGSELTTQTPLFVAVAS